MQALTKGNREDPLTRVRERLCSRYSVARSVSPSQATENQGTEYGVGKYFHFRHSDVQFITCTVLGVGISKIQIYFSILLKSLYINNVGISKMNLSSPSHAHARERTGI
jgi:hypothetical protein